MTEIADIDVTSTVRTISSITNPHWNNSDQTVLTVDVEFVELSEFGPLPFSTSDNSDTIHGQAVWDRVTAGEFGSIAAYVPPTAEELRERMFPLTARQLRLTLTRNGISMAQVDAAIAAMPDGQEKEEAGIEWEYATTFERLSPTLLAIAGALDLTPEQVDTLWEQALSV